MQINWSPNSRNSMRSAHATAMSFTGQNLLPPRFQVPGLLQQPSPQRSPIGSAQLTQDDFNKFVQMLKSPAPLEKQAYYHGILPREEINLLLQNNGDFIVRESIKGNESQWVISIFWQKPVHYLINQHQLLRPNEKGITKVFGLPGTECYCTVPELILDLFLKRQALSPGSDIVLVKPIPKEKWELSNDDIKLNKCIGRGNFGEVWKAQLRITDFMTGTELIVDVAVKTCKMEIPDSEKAQFLGEARILRQFCHPNITNFIGVCASKMPIMIVMEFVEGGSLQDYLSKNKGKSSLQHRISFCADASAGMEYLEAKGCIHRDLAARNCLLTTNCAVKISDFGMSRAGHQYKVHGMKQIPVRWTAPEALQTGQFSSKSDVWSFGVLCWEIFSDAAIPYGELDPNKAQEMIVKEGYRLQQPPTCPDEIYGVIKACWHGDSTQRPTFAQLRFMLLCIFANYTAAFNIQQPKTNQKSPKSNKSRKER